MIRKFEFKNNYLSTSLDELMATFCSIGYFDGMETKLIEENDAAASLSAPMETHTVPNEDNEYDSYEKCDYFSIVGLRKDSSLDEKFWSSEQEAPFVFVTCLRLKSRSAYLEIIMENLEKIPGVCCYSTLDSSDMLIAMRRGSYVEGCAVIERMYPELIAACDRGNGIQKSFTTVSVKQEILNDLEHLGKNMVDDVVCCKLNCVFNHWKNVDAFLSALRTATGKTEWERYGVLGSNDIAIMIDRISVRNLFGLYSNEKELRPGNQEAEIKGLLHHGCKVYKEAFVNVTTELLVTDGQMTAYMDEGLSAVQEEIIADLRNSGKSESGRPDNNKAESKNTDSSWQESESADGCKQERENTDRCKPEGGGTDAG